MGMGDGIYLHRLSNPGIGILWAALSHDNRAIWLPGIMYFLMEARQSLAGKLKNQFSFQNRLFHPDNLLIEITGWFCFCLFLYLALLQLPSGFLPPVGYDALEYHFGAPTYYLEHHSIVIFPETLMRIFRP
jgi:hypothetical protein